MGNCYRRPAQEISDQLRYYAEVQLHVKSRDAGKGSDSTQAILVRLVPPQSLSSETVRVGSTTLEVSACVMPGCDPVEGLGREGQDAVLVTSTENGALVALFDGHGKEGRKVVDFCKKWLLEHFQQHSEYFAECPEQAIVQACESCDAVVKQDLECLLSGTSAVLVFISEQGVSVGSVGDAKAIVAALPSLTGAVPSKSSTEESKRQSGPYRRILAPSRVLEPIQLTIDHQPNHSEELQRILEAGGRVSRLTDDAGNKVGPHRVWKKNGHKPGLAASRSLGDKMASELGVIPTPLTRRYELKAGQDQFLVLASDGVWYFPSRNVMTDQEVVNFVEKFRRQCLKSPTAKPAYPIRPANSVVSQLLCEEARYRWLGLVEEESVAIDDISCLVLELDGTTAFPIDRTSDWQTPGRPQKPVPVQEGEEAIHFPKQMDPLRQSIILPPS